MTGEDLHKKTITTAIKSAAEIRKWSQVAKTYVTIDHKDCLITALLYKKEEEKEENLPTLWNGITIMYKTLERWGRDIEGVGIKTEQQNEWMIDLVKETYEKEEWFVQADVAGRYLVIHATDTRASGYFPDQIGNAEVTINRVFDENFTNARVVKNATHRKYFWTQGYKDSSIVPEGDLFGVQVTVTEEFSPSEPIPENIDGISVRVEVLS